MTESKDKIGISLKNSILVLIFGLVVIILPKNILHPLIYTIGNALYFFGTLGLFLNLISKNLKIQNKVLIILTSFLLSTILMVFTYQIHKYFSEKNSIEIKSNGIKTIAIIKNVYTTTSLKGRKNSYANIEFTGNHKTYNITIDIDKEALKYHAINDTLIIKYSGSNPHNFEIIENKNRRLQEDIIELSNYMEK